MSYTVLALKWRPKRFEELVGQPHVVQALVNSLAQERLHHAYLFSGTRGVGKTTVARILAKALNCARGIVAEPCGECEACVAIDEGRFVDLIEVDAASRTRIDDTRELLDNVQYAPSHGRYKVYLIDEVHMLSQHSFNALLKTLEEPPPHVKFLLATTDPQKLPVTVLSRCLQFHLKKLSVAQIDEQLTKICAAESVDAEPAGLRALAKAAQGSMRDALSLLDQSIAFGGGSIAAEQVVSMLGSIDREHVINVLTALADGDGAALVAETDRLEGLGADFASVLDELSTALQRIAVMQLIDGAPVAEEDEIFAPFVTTFTPEDVQLYYQIALHGRRDLAISHDERMGFEMTLLRMLAFRPVDSGDARQSLPGTGKPATAPRSGRAPQSSGTAKAARRTDDSMPDADVAPARPPGSNGAARDTEIVSESEGAAGSDGNDVPLEVVSSNLEPVEDGWGRLLSAADIRGAARQLADNCEIAKAGESTLDLVLASDKQHLLTEQIRSRLEGSLASHLGAPLRLTIRPGSPPRQTPAELRIANDNERMRKAREAIEGDPAVQAMQTAFDAVVEADTVQPIDEKQAR